MHLSKVTQVCSNQGCMTYFHGIMHGFASNFLWMFPGWTPTKFDKIGVLPLFSMELWKFWAIFGKFLKIIFLKDH